MRSIGAYAARDDPAAALRLVETIIDSAEATLLSSLGVGPPGRVKGTREWVAHKRYIVVYRVRHDHLDVVNVRQASAGWPRRF